MKLQFIISFILICLLPRAISGAGTATPPQAPPESAPEDSLAVSILTCYPGTEEYELYGHSAIRIRNAEFDSVWNYGVFDFNSPNFITRFALGDTDYMLDASTTDRFLLPYRADKRRVEELKLNLTQDEARRMRAALQENALPQNRSYRYNFLADNCATRIFDRIEDAVGDTIRITAPPRFNTYREALKCYHGKALWYAMGVDMALGADIDKPLTQRQQVFLPLELMRVLQTADFPDGRKVVSADNVVINNPADSADNRTNDIASPMFINTLIAIIGMFMCMFFLYRRRVNRLVYAVFFSLIGIIGLVMSFLVFVCDHPGTDINYLLIWLNPLALIVPAFIFCKKNSLHRIVYPYMLAKTFGILLFFALWPLFHQEINYSLIPLAFTDLIFSVTYCIIDFKRIMHGTTAEEAIQRQQGSNGLGRPNNSTGRR